MGLELGEEFVRRQHQKFAGGVVGLVPRDDCANASFRLRGEVLNRVLEILETRRKGKLDFRLGHGRNANQRLQLAEQGQRITMPFEPS